MARYGLDAKARGFATTIASVLNRTICDHVNVSALETPWAEAGNAFSVGTGLSKSTLDTSPALVLTVGGKCWLRITMLMFLDERGYLTVQSSTYSISTGEDGDDELFHFDYERDKTNGYPEAHLQVIGENPALSRLLADVDRPKTTMQKLHLPTGVRRFRPTIEDVIEFLCVEKIADPQERDWKAILAESRSEYDRIQHEAAAS